MATTIIDDDNALFADSPSPPPRCRRYQAHDTAPRVPFKCKQLFRGTLDEDVDQFIDMFETQATLARLTEDDKLLLLPTCLADKASRWYQAEKRTNGPFDSYDDLRSSFMGRFTPTQAERKTQKLKLKALRQKDSESVIEFNDRFDALASECYYGEDEAKDIYVDCLRPRLRDALDVRAPSTLAEAMRVAVTVDVNLSRRGDAAPPAQTTTATAQVNELTSQMDRMSTRRAAHPYNSGRQCNKCGRHGHLAAKCGVKCTACGRWGHTMDTCRSKGNNVQPTTPKDRSRNGNGRDRPTCEHCGRVGHTKDRCFRNPESSSYRPRNTNGPNQGN